MESKFIQYKNKKIHYRVTGKGKPVILLHGFGQDGTIWDELITDLEVNFHFIVPDIPGSGKSEILEGENVTIEDYADVIKSIWDEELSKAAPSATFGGAIIGHSMGGYITLAFAEKYPALVNRFGLFHSSAFADDDEKIKTRTKAIDFIKTNGAPAFLKTAIPALFADKQNSKIDELIQQGNNFSSEALIQYYQAMINRPDRTGGLKNFNKPILFIIGEKDSAIPLQSSLKQTHLPAISHVHILNTGHMAMIEMPGECKTILLNFLNT